MKIGRDVSWLVYVKPKKIFLILIGLFLTMYSFAQVRIPGGPIICPADPQHHDFKIAPPASYLKRMSNGRTADGGANFVVTYNGFTQEAKEAFQFAVDIWASLIKSDVTIHINANWTPLDAGILGSAGPTAFFKDFDGAPVKGTFYAVALAEKLAGYELNESGVSDISASFSSTFSWYLGTDGKPGGQYDFVTVVLHEIGHGLGFAEYGSFVDSGQGYWDFSGEGDPAMYGPYVVNGTGQRLIDQNDGSSALAAYLQSNNLFLNGPLAIKANGNNAPKIYAPNPYNGGSSISHWDDATFDGTVNALMTHAVSSGEAMHNPGPNTMSLFADMQWITSGYRHNPVSIVDANLPFKISTQIFTDTTLTSTNLMVKYIYTGALDTLEVLMTEAWDNTYEASIALDNQYSSLSYYISGLADALDRSYTSPLHLEDGLHQVEYQTFQLVSAPYTLASGGDFENGSLLTAIASGTENQLWEKGVTTGKFASLNASQVWKTKLNGTIGKPDKPIKSLLLTPFIDLSDTTKDYTMSFDYIIESTADFELTVRASLDTTRSSRVLGATNDQLGVNWYNGPNDSFESSTLDESGDLEKRTASYPLYTLAGSKPILGFQLMLNGDLPDADYQVEGALIDNFQILVTEPRARFYVENRDQVLFPGDEVYFKYASSGAQSFHWDFGDGDTSIERNPTHIYEIGGNYDVSLTVSYPGGSHTNTVQSAVTTVASKGSSYTLMDGGDFESNFSDFLVENISGTRLELGKSTITGKAGTASGDKAWVLGINEAGYLDQTRAFLYTPMFDFSTFGDYKLSFEANYQLEEGWDAFIIEYTLDTGTTWTQLKPVVNSVSWYDLIGEDNPDQGWPAIPMFSGNTGNTFVTKSISIPELGGNPTVGFRFHVLSDFAATEVGLAIDNFSLEGPVAGTITADLELEFVSGSQGCDGQSIRFSAALNGSFDSIDWDFGMGAVPQTAEGIGPHVVEFGSGTNQVTLELMSSNQQTIIRDTIVQTNDFHVAELVAVQNPDGTTSLTASPGDAYQWYRGATLLEGETGQTLLVIESGDYLVKVFKGACPASTNFESVKVLSTSNSEKKMKIYPNPINQNEELVINWEKGIGNTVTVQLFDLTGRVITKITSQSFDGQLILNVGDCPKGIYLIEIKSDVDSQTVRLMVR